ncbi:ABC transporter ATP-binding protein [Gracilibacillus dipsosauri]|uniref:ABC transporter ATP-binding protein n=1 Tax=Gracilibacillus dipsosauri TaxID=178340 RepID=UPI002408F9E9
MNIIEAQNLTKEYKRFKRFPGFWGAMRTLMTQQYSKVPAVNDLSFKINAGETVGYLGPNGAGKSTMIKMLTGILVPTAGQLFVRGKIPHQSRMENARKMGVVFGQRSQLWWELPMIDSFEVHRHVYKIDEKTYKKNLDFCTELLDLGSFLNSPVRQLSLGQRMRAEIAISLLHDPEILFLDEPTIGLDVLAKDNIRQFLRKVNQEKNVTILLTTHDLQDIEEVCSRMLIVNKGNLVYDGTTMKLRENLGNLRKIRVELKENLDKLVINDLTFQNGDGNIKYLIYERELTNILEVIDYLSQKYTVIDLSIEAASIEDVIRRLYHQLGASNMNELNRGVIS